VIGRRINFCTLVPRLTSDHVVLLELMKALAGVGVLVLLLGRSGIISLLGRAPPRRVEHFRIMSPDRGCTLVSETYALGLGGVRMSLECGVLRAGVARTVGDVLAGNSAVAGREDGKTHALMCNMYLPKKPAVVSFERPFGRLLPPSDEQQRELRKEMVMQNPGLRANAEFASLAAEFCSSIEGYDAFKNAHPTKRFGWFRNRVDAR
jgi:hypothetical protein